MATTEESNPGRDYVMVDEDHLDGAGATVYWSLTGDTDRLKLLDALNAQQNLADHAPPAHSPESCLQRAVAVLRGKRRLIRPLRKGSWAVVEEQLNPTSDALKHWTGPTVSLDMIGRPVLKNATAEEAKLVQDAYAYHWDALTAKDVSAWLIEQAGRLGAVTLRKGGGFYYMPPRAMPEWRQIISCLGEGHTVYKVPTIRMTKAGAQAILDALQSEVDAEVDRISTDVISGELGVRGLETRAGDAGSILAKVEQYETLLGSRLEKLRVVLSKLEADVAAAKLAAEAEEDAS